MPARERMSLVDAAWLSMEEPTNLMMITGVLWFDEPVDWERLRRVVVERLVGRYPRFSQRPAVRPQAMNLPEWEDAEVDLARHLRHEVLPAPGGRGELQARVSELLSTPLEMDRPLWQLHLVDGVGGGSAVIARLHHAIADGIALARVLLTLTDSERSGERGRRERRPVERPLMSRLTRQVRRAVRQTRRVVEEGTGFLGSPERLWTTARVTTESALTLARILAMPADPQTVLKGPLGVEKRAVWSEPVPLEAIKAVGRSMGGTVNDVMMAVVTGALRRYLLATGGPMVNEVRACIPVNLRPLDQPLPRKLGNKFGLVFLALPVGREDPKDRLARLKRGMDALKQSPQAVVTYGVLNAMALAPLPLERALIDLVGSKASTVLTNVPGPREPVYLAGSKLAGMIFWVPQSGHVGLGISIFSYAGEVLVGLAADAGVIPHPEQLVGLINEELASLGTRS